MYKSWARFAIDIILILSLCLAFVIGLWNLTRLLVPISAPLADIVWAILSLMSSVPSFIIMELATEFMDKMEDKAEHKRKRKNGGKP